MAVDRGRPGRFEQVYDQHVVRIYRFIHARVGNRFDAEDLTAQVFTRALEQLDVDRDEAQITGWLYRVSANLVADYWRAFYRLPVVDGDRLAPGWEPADRPAASGDPDVGAVDRVRQLLDQLPANYRRVLELRFLQRLSVAETAEQMGVTRANAKVLQYRALRRAALAGNTDD